MEHYPDLDVPQLSLEFTQFATENFWRVELAFQRGEGAVKTAVGYSEGHFHNLHYKIVCTVSKCWEVISAYGATGNVTGVRIIVTGDAKTYKSSLIMTAAIENYSNNVSPLLPPTRLPEDVYPDRMVSGASN
ncbi:Mitochondrial Rho GTPase [Forsythia ovata]|uniref:peptide-methionine (S)-S-oxide reductase n=1 Tax=Forsythia ovata TaxID=205694 RepID=A0ABD1S1G1_9LAMI